MTAAYVDRPFRLRIPAPHFSGSTLFEQAASRAWGLSLIEARVLLVVVKNNGITCANLGAELWGSERHSGRGSNCSCPWARPAGKVMGRLRSKGLVELDNDPDRFRYIPTSKVEALINK